MSSQPPLGHHNRITSLPLLLGLLIVAASATAAVIPDGGDPFSIFVGTDSYRFSPNLPGKLGTERLYAIISHPDAAAAQKLGPMLWTLELRGPGRDTSIVRTVGGKAWPDEGGNALVEFLWDGRTDSGELAPAGLYTGTFRARLVPMAAIKGRAIETYEDAGTIPQAEEADPTSDEVVIDPTLTIEDSLEIRASRAMGVCDAQQNAPIESGFAYNFYYGSTHSHSSYSDGGHPISSCGTGVGTGTFDPIAVYDYARTVGSLDYWFITDHNHLFEDAVAASDPPVTEAKVLQRYQDGLAAATSSTVDDAFVAVWGQEFGVISNGGHVNTIETPGLFGWETCSDCNSPTPQCTPGTNCYFNWYVPKLTHYLTLYAQSVAHPSPVGPLGTLAHPQSGDYDNYVFDANADDAMQGIAVRSGLASSSSTSCLDSNVGSTNYFSRWMTALNKGFHLGPTAEQDAHCNNYGVANPTRTVYLLPNGTAPVLTKTALLTAHRTRHFFATEDTNAQIVFATNDSSHIMGDIFTVATSVSLRAAVFDPSAETVSTIELWRGQIGGGVLTTAYQTVSNQATFAFTDTPAPGTYYYFIHAVQQDGHDIYTAPMWITFTGAPPCTTPPDLTGVPTATDVVACGDSGVTVAWTDITTWNDTGSTGTRTIEILRSTNGTTWTSCGVDPDLTSPFVDTGGTNGTAYFYRVKATNKCGAVAQVDTTTTATDQVNGPVFAGVQSVTDLDACALTGVQLQWPAATDWNDGCTSGCTRTVEVRRDGTGVATWMAEVAPTTMVDTPPPGPHTYSVVLTNHLGCANDGGVTRSGSDATDDGAAPTITVGPATTPAVTSVTITWTTNEASDSRVEYGPTAAYGSTSTNPALVTVHSVTIGDLTAATPYHFRAGSADGCSNGPTWSSDGTFTTLTAPVGLDISGWKIVQHSPPSTTRTYTFPAGTTIAPGEYIIIGRNAAQAAFETFWAAQIPGYSVPANAHYLNGGDKLVVNDNEDSLELQNASSVIVDGVTPALPGLNSSVKRSSPADPATVISSWVQTAWTTANPGSGQTPVGTTNLVLNEVADAIGTGNYIYEFVELYYDTTASTTARLMVAKAGAGAGTVVSDPEGIDCGAVCEADFPHDAEVQLVASPDPGSSFDGWSGACSGSGSCTVTMDAARSVTATFSLISLVPTASGTPTYGQAPMTVAFTASATGGAPGYTWYWEFDDGYTSTEQNPTHTFNDSGNFGVICWVTDAAGISKSTIVPISVYLPATPMALVVDTHTPGTGASDLNQVLEPGETVLVEPSWYNSGGVHFTATGEASDPSGPGASNLTIIDGHAEYGLFTTWSTLDCYTAKGDCLSFQLAPPAKRPANHWDLTFTESLSSGTSTSWTLHVGDSFADVARSHWAYRFIETIFHNSVTSGCNAMPFNYCPGTTLTRAEMAVLLLMAKHGPAWRPPLSTGTVFTDVPTDHWAGDFIEELAAEGITRGCDTGRYCPDAPITRAEMAVFLIVADHGTGYHPPLSTGLIFTDVPIDHWAGDFIEQLAAEGITGGCAPSFYCPATPVTRAEMAVFLTAMFELRLY